MTKQKRGDHARGRNNDPNQDVQPWLGWIAALLVVVIVVVAVAMGMERTNNQRNAGADVRMTPLVGGIEVPVVTEASTVVAVAAEVTPVPEDATGAVTESDTITMVTVITSTEITETGSMTGTDSFTATGEMTPTVTITVTESVTGPVTGTDEVSATVTVSETAEVTATTEADTTAESAPGESATGESDASLTPVAEASATLTATDEPAPTLEESDAESGAETVEPTTTVAATASPRPTATRRPTATSTRAAQVFDVGATLAASGGRVELYADVAVDAVVLDSIGPGIELEVLPPSGDYTDYPVVVDGIGWVRVRAADGLAGWVQADLVEEQ